MLQGIVQDKEVSSSMQASKQSTQNRELRPSQQSHQQNALSSESPPEMRLFPFAEFNMYTLSSLCRLGVHAIHRVELIHLIRPGRAGVLCHASVVPWPTGEKLSQCLIL